MNKKWLITTFVLVFVLAGCGGSSQVSTEWTVVANDFNYSPNTISVPVGEQISITFRNEGQVEHDFVVQTMHVSGVEEHVDEMSMDESDGHDEGEDVHDDEHTAEFALHTSTNPGETSTLTFVPEEAGEYEIFCTVEGHKEAGMIGKLIVVARE